MKRLFKRNSISSSSPQTPAPGDRRPKFNFPRHEKSLTLSNLPSTLKKGSFTCEEGEGKLLMDNILKGNESNFTNNQFEESWLSYEYVVEVRLVIMDPCTSSLSQSVVVVEENTVPDGALTNEGSGEYYKIHLSFLDMIVILRQYSILKRIILKANTLEHFTKKVKVEGQDPFNIAEDDFWILDANCFHFAAKFNPKGLLMILDGLGFEKNKDFIEAIHEEGTMTPLHVSATNSDPLSTSILMSYKAPLECVNAKGYTPLFYASKAGSLKTMIELLENGASVHHQSDINKKTALFKARCPQTVVLLLRYGADPNHLIPKKVTSYPHVNSPAPATNFGRKLTHYQKKESISAIEHLMSVNPKCAQAILDDCMSVTDDNTLVMDFQILDPEESVGPDASFNNNEMALFQTITETKKWSLCLHPLLQIFLQMKFSAIEGFFVLQVLYDLLHTYILTALAVKYVEITDCRSEKDDTIQNSTFIGNILTKNTNLTCDLNVLISNDEVTDCRSWQNDITHTSTFNDKIILETTNVTCDNNILKHVDSWELQPVLKVLDPSYNSLWDLEWMKWLMILSYFFITSGAIREIYQMLRQGVTKYISSIENWIESLVLILTIMFLIAAPKNTMTAAHFAAWMVFCQWTDLLLLLAKFDTMGRYIFMSVDVTKTMIFCIVTYVPSLCAFSFGFHILLKPNPVFRSWFATIVKTLSMMTGEFDYDDIFAWDAVKEYGGRNYSTQIMFICFVISITLIVMNLLLAVTISNTENLAERSKLLLAKRRIDDVLLATKYPKWLSKLMNSLSSNCSLPIVKWFVKRRLPILQWGSIDKKNQERKTKFCMKGSDEHRQRFRNKIRSRLNFDLVREVFFFEHGKKDYMSLNVSVSNVTYLSAVEYVLDKDAKNKELLNSIEEEYRKSRKAFYEISKSLKTDIKSPELLIATKNQNLEKEIKEVKEEVKGLKDEMKDLKELIVDLTNMVQKQ